MSDSAIEDVRNLFEGESAGVLCTAHASLAGWPFGSVVPYAMLDNGDPVVFLSDIAEHTHNLLADPRATLFVADSASSGAPQRGPRHAMMVRAVRPGGAAMAAVEACYFARFPQAEAMRSAHGFACWVLECERIRWIAGFGAMGWIDRAGWTGRTVPLADPLAEHAAGVVAHLNRDHGDALATLVTHLTGIPAASAQATGLDRGGLDVRATDDAGGVRETRLPFPEVAATPDDVRRIVVEMLRAARE